MTVTGNRKGAGAKLGAEDVSAARNDLEDPTFQESLRISSAGRLSFIPPRDTWLSDLED